MDTEERLEDKHIKNIENNIDKINDNRIRHLVLVNKHLIKLLDCFFKTNIHILKSIFGIREDIFIYFIMKNYHGFYVDKNIRFKKSPLSLIDSDTEVLLILEENIFPIKRCVKNCFIWSRKNHRFWNDCLGLLTYRLKVIFDNNMDVTKWSDEDISWISSHEIMKVIKNEKYRYDKGIKVLNHYEYFEYLESEQYLQFKNWF